MPTTRAHVIIRGRVQGVCFRMCTQDQARARGLSGWVRNRYDGSVEAVFEGDAARVEDMIDWCRRGPSMAHVAHVDVTRGEAQGAATGFSIRPSV